MTESHLKESVLEAERAELQEFINENKRTINGRKLIGEFLLFVGCQTMSAGLAILLFQFTFKLWVLSLLCYAISAVPTMPDLCDVNINKTDQGGWEVTIMRSPLKTVVKFALGIGITYVGINETKEAVEMTYHNIDQVYAEIHTYERPKTSQYQLPVEPMMLIAAIGIVALVSFLRDKL